MAYRRQQALTLRFILSAWRRVCSDERAFVRRLRTMRLRVWFRGLQRRTVAERVNKHWCVRTVAASPSVCSSFLYTLGTEVGRLCVQLPKRSSY